MSSWRPEGWENLPIFTQYKEGVIISDPRIKHLDLEERRIFEAGADAILNYLLSYGIISISQLEELNNNGIRNDNRIENLELLSDKKHKPSTQLARHIKQKEDEAYKRGVEDGKRKMLEALRERASGKISITENRIIGISHPDEESESKNGVYVFIPDDEE